MSDRIALTYCSFVKEICVGVLVLDGAHDPISASKTAWALGLNPGGELMSIVIPPETPERLYLAMAENRNRLLRPDEARELMEAKPIREWETETR